MKRAIQTGFGKLTEVLARELGALRAKLKAEIAALRLEFKTEIRDTRYELQKSITGQGWKVIGAVLTIVTNPVEIITLFPGAPG
jgi:hypothetical protein